MKHITCFLSGVLLVALFACEKKKGSSEAPPAEPPLVASKVQPFGVNYSGAEFGVAQPGTYNRDYTFPLAAELDYFKAKGLTMVRFPFKWERVQVTMGGALDAAYLGRMKTFVQAAADRGMPVLLDMHNFGRRKVGSTTYVIGSPEVPLSAVADVWKRLALEFKDYPNLWGYGIMNEPYNMLSTAPWVTIAQQIINGIRTVDKQTTIVVGGDSYSSAVRWKTVSDNLKTLQDPVQNLLFEAHTYLDHDGSGTYKYSYDEEGATPATGVDRIRPFVDWLKENGKRGMLGEYGVPDNDARWLVALDNMLQYAKEHCVNGTYWSAGPWWGSYTLAVEPRGGVDRSQMTVLARHLEVNPVTCRP